METKLIFALIIIVYWLFYRIPTVIVKKVQTHVVKRKRLNLVGELPLLISLIFYGVFVYFLINTSIKIGTNVLAIAIVLFVTSAVLNEWSRIVLGKQWSGSARIIQDHKLIREGPYSLCRHPMYFANLLMMFSGIFVMRSGIMFVLFTLNFFILIYRMRVEEEELIREFGKEYESYKKDVKGLIPLIY